MKIAVISYSFTGNNEALAKQIAHNLSVEHISLSESKKRNYFTIFLDIMFNRTPKVTPNATDIDNYDYVIFVAPIWIGQPAFPLRSYLKYLKKHPKKYAFVTVSGDGNADYIKSVTKRAGSEPEIFASISLNEFLPKEIKDNFKELMNYRLPESEIISEAEKITAQIKSKINSV